MNTSHGKKLNTLKQTHDIRDNLHLDLDSEILVDPIFVLLTAKRI